jgi:AraC-like DNA-binding protein
MPKLVDYSDRFDGIREAVHLITLDEGVGAISLDAVAPRAFLSRRTLQRLINSAAALPYLGLQWAERVESRRALRRLSYRDDRRDHERAVDSLISSLPGDQDLEDRTVWWLLVTGFVADPDHESRRLAMLVNEPSRRS